jgi:hypothetical protein
MARSPELLLQHLRRLVEPLPDEAELLARYRRRGPAPVTSCMSISTTSKYSTRPNAPSRVVARVVDHVERVSNDESVAMVGRLLLEEGQRVGGTSGTTVVAALRVAQTLAVDDPIVAALADSWDAISRGRGCSSLPGPEGGPSSQNVSCHNAADSPCR